MLKSRIRRGASITAFAISIAAPAWAQAPQDPAAADSSPSTNAVNAAANAAAGANTEGAAKDSNTDSGQLEEIVVTAQKRAENLQKVPLSVVAIGGPALEARGITNVLDLSGSVPGLQISLLKGVVLPFIRGVGATGNSLSIESKVAVYVDGVYYARLSSGILDLKNIQRVEVLKGPQGTLFGRNATGGVISIVTRDPSHNPSVEGSVGYGNYQQYNGDLYATTGLSDTVAMDVAVSASTNDGYGKNITTGNRYEYTDNVIVRSKLLFEPTDLTHITLSGFYNWGKQSGTKGGFPGTAIRTLTMPYETYRVEQFGYHNLIDDTDGRDIFKVWNVSFRAQQDLPFARLTSISAYVHDHENSLFEGDRTPRPDFSLTYSAEIKQFTQELQLASLPDSPFQWIGGLYYYNNLTSYNMVHFREPTVFGPAGLFAPAHQKAISYAAFAQATYEILPRLKLTGGIRYTSDKTSAAGTAFIGTTPPRVILALPESTTRVKKPTYKASVDYQATDNLLLYALFSRSFKSGNYNILTYNSVTPTKPEFLNDYEGGIKADLFDKRVRFNAAVFHYDIKNPQVQLLQNNTVFFSNAGAATVKGAELDGEVVVVPGLTGRFGATFLDSKYTDYPNAPTSIPDFVNGGANPTANIDAKGNRTPLAPKTVFNVGGDYKLHTSAGDFLLTADFEHNSGYFYEPDNFLHQKAYDLLSAQLRYKPTDHLAVRVYGRNLLNVDYTSSGSTQVGPAGYIWSAAPPRTYGVAVDFNF